MRVAQIMSKDVVTCRTTDTLAAAAHLMWEHDIGCVPIVDGEGHVAGVITDRDACMAAYTRGQPLHAVPVTAAMARRVLTCRPDDSIATIESIMSNAQIRRMPVVDDQGHPIGIVSLNDLARASARKSAVTSAEVASLLASVCAPRRAVVASGA